MSEVFCVTMTTDQKGYSALEAALFERASEGFELRDATVDPGLGERVLLLLHGSRAQADEWLSFAAQPEVAEVLLAATSCEVAEPVDWAEAWKVHFKPLRLSRRLTVVPSWEHYHAPPGVMTLPVDPGTAFGTGQHPTTALCVRALDRLADDAPLGSFADIGCGTGILCMAALRLGADRCYATENDAHALAIARENLAAADMLGSVTTECCEAPSTERQYDLVVANILAPVLARLAESLEALLVPRGALLLSGLLNSQADALIERYGRLGLRVSRRAEEGDWMLLEMRRG
jgi:ribosomal protein L11 methyltransferase